MQIHIKIGFALAAAAAVGAFPAVSAGHGGPSAHHEMSLAVVNAKGAKSLTLDIAHVQEGCHIFAAGKKQSYNMKVLLKRGAALRIVNRDTDGHQFVQKAGPKIATARLPMMGKASIVFKKAGTYRLVTKSFDMPGMPEMETEGGDHPLQLTLVVT